MKIKLRFVPYFLTVGMFLIFAASCSKDSNAGSNDNSNTAAGKIKAPEFNSKVTYGTMTDQDGNVYKTVTIGMQTWMAENLRVKTYNDGTSITNMVYHGHGLNGGYCNYNNTDNPDTISTYGRLYDWYAVNTGKLAPKGWHVPSQAEWTTLVNYLGGENVAGGKIREAGTDHWKGPNTGGTNESGFTAIPCGVYSHSDDFGNSGEFTAWWTSDYYFDYTAYVMCINDNCSTMYCGGTYSNINTGYSVRCVKD
ncbi:MAG: FISUMP domain-containing protein [Bacteroidota bacterium]|nr:FISUMP domain-containing protein [Bacteroidota bacterium]